VTLADAEQHEDYVPIGNFSRYFVDDVPVLPAFTVHELPARLISGARQARRLVSDCASTDR